MKLHASIASRPWSSLKGTKLHIRYFNATLHVGIAFKVGHLLKMPKSPMGYFETNLNMAIAFRARYSYNFAIPTHIFTFTN
jgi:hypothetical protein